MGEGRVSLDDRVVPFSRGYAARNYTESSCDDIRNLLMMGTGHAEDHNNGATYMLSAILAKGNRSNVIGISAAAAVRTAGHQEDSESCHRGIHIGGWGMKIKTDDIAKFGQLYLQKGQWDGNQLIPEIWVEEATTKQIK